MLWIKAFHIISMVTWFAGLFYLPRLFVYHAMTKDEVSHERFKVMEKKLFWGIMTPSLIATFVFGIWMAVSNWDIYKTQGWLHAKLFLVVLLVVYHKLCKLYMRRFAENQNTKSHVYFRWFNEAPAVILIAIVILAVVKPF